MVTFTSHSLRKLVKESDPENQSLEAVDGIDFLEFQDLEESVKQDVEYLRNHPLLIAGTKVSGYIHDVETGKV